MLDMGCPPHFRTVPFALRLRLRRCKEIASEKRLPTEVIQAGIF